MPQHTRLIDGALQRTHFAEHHSMEMRASPERVFAELARLDLGRSRIVRMLFRLRGLEWRDLRLESLIDSMHMTRSSSEEERLFVGTERALGANLDLAWNFVVQPIDEGHALVSTETRVHCSRPWLRAVFSAYWLVIKPFSGWIRLEMLRLLREQAEAS